MDGVDRARAFDQTYRASATGNPKRAFYFSTPPITPVIADLYESVLKVVTPQNCSGDIIEGQTNLFTVPEDLDNAAWTKVRATITPNTGVAPDGASTADRLVEDSTPTNSHLITRTPPTMVNNTIYRFSVFGKLADAARSQLYLALADKAGATTYRIFSVSTGTIGIGPATARIESDEAGWYRSSVDISSASGGSTPAFTMAMAVSDAINYTGNGVGEMLLWRASMVETVVSCCAEITGWTPVRTADGHRVVLDFVLYEV